MSRRLLVIAGVASLLLGGCGADPEPRIGTAPSSSAATPTPTPTPTETAAVAESPEEFVERWLQASVEMQNSGDSTTYRALISGCQPCLDLSDRVDGYYSNGGYVRFSGQTASDVRVVPSVEGTVVLRVKVNSLGVAYKTADGTAEKKLPPGRDLLEVTLVPAGTSWAVRDYARIAQ